MAEIQNINQLPKDWKLEEFNQIANLIRGVSYDKQYVFSNPEKGLLPLMRATNIQKELVLEEFVYVPEKLVKKEQFIKEGDILLAMSSGSKELVGKAAQAKQNYEIAFGTFCGLIRPNEKINKKFFGYFFQTRNYRNYVSSISKGIGINNLRRNHIEDLKIPFPPKPTQQAIVSKIEELFSELDKGIEQLKIAQQQLKTYRQSVLKWAFEGRLTEEWREQHGSQVRDLSSRRESAMAAEPEMAYGKNNDLPEGWEYMNLGKYIEDINSGKSFRCDERPPKKDEIGIVKVSSVTWGFFDEMESKTCFSTDLLNEKYLIKKGDFLFSRANTIELIGACVLVNRIEKTLMLSDKILRFTFSKSVSKEFVLYYLRSRKGRKQIELLSTGNQDSMRNIGQEKIRQIEFPYCSIEEQDQIVQEIESRLSVADKMEENITQSLQQAEALRQSILKKAFEGRLVN